MTTELYTTPTHIPADKQKTFFGHPSGLYILFFTEMWERFSYYGMRALLTLYMVNYLIKDPAKASAVFGFDALRHILETGFGPLETQPLALQIYGLYTGFVYLSPFFGGILADKVWGQKKSVYIGGVLMAIGHFLMASEQMFLLALFFLILGNGAFKPNISSQVGNLYAPGDSRRDGAFTIFYMGINLGAFICPFICGTLGEKVGWHYGFGAAGVGMLAGLGIYHWGRRLIPHDEFEKQIAKGLPSPSKGAGYAAKTVAGFLAAMVLFLGLLMLPAAIKAVIIIAVFAAIVFAINKIEGKDDKQRVIVLCILCVCTIAFWAIYEQQGGTLELWADQKTDLTFFGWTMPSSWYQSFNPLMIIAFAPFLDMYWGMQSRKGKASSSVRKMCIGSILCGLAFIIMIVAARVVGPGAEKGSILWLLSRWENCIYLRLGFPWLLKLRRNACFP